MKVTTLDEASIRDIGQAFGHYNYGEEHGLIDAFPSRDAAAAFICGYVRMALQGGMLHTTSPRGEGDRLGVPVILETDAKSKCDKYVHLGMELTGVRDIGEFGKLYDLIKKPDAEKQQSVSTEASTSK